MTDYTESHWQQVHDVVAEAVDEAGYTLKLVSQSDGATVILRKIISNLYENPIIIADVSGRNPNVMFELGMRLAFEKPAIIIKDKETPFSFDISPVNHIEYPRSLRYPDIIKFKGDIVLAIKETISEASKPGNIGYLQQFGPIKVTEIRDQSVGIADIAQDVQDMKRTISSLAHMQMNYHLNEPIASPEIRFLRSRKTDSSTVDVEVPDVYEDEFENYLMGVPLLEGYVRSSHGFQVIIGGGDMSDVSEVRNAIREYARSLRARLKELE